MSDETTSLAQILLKTVSVNVCFDESLCTNHLLPRGSTPCEPRGVVVLVFLFSQQGMELFSFGKGFAGQ